MYPTSEVVATMLGISPKVLTPPLDALVSNLLARSLGL